MQDYKDFLYKEEIEGYTEYLKEFNFDKKLYNLSCKYKNKKVLIYGTGLLFDVINKNYNLDEYLNICAVSDLKYEKEQPSVDMKYKAIKPADIKTEDIDVVLVSTVNPQKIKDFLINNNCVKQGTKILPLIQNTFRDKIFQFINKLNLAFEYVKTTKKLFNCLKYTMFLDEKELKTKINYAKVLSNLKKDKNRKIRIAFLCEENSKWGYQSVYEGMKNDKNFEVLPIINLPIITTGRQEFLQEKNAEFFSSFDMNSVDGYDDREKIYKPLREFAPDIVFYQQPWYVIQSQKPQKVSDYALTAIVSYGFTSINADSWGSDSVRKFSGNLWKMFAESDYHNKFYQKAAKLKHKDILVTKGYPKLDNYRKPINERFELLWKDKDKENKHRIIWAPHHSIDKSDLKMSMFCEQYEYFLNLAKKHPEYSFVLKPHPALRHKCLSERFMTAEEYDNYIAEWNSLDNGTVYTEGNYFDIFKTSDVLITDSSSFLAEYFYSGKPIIFFESENRACFNEFGKKIKKGFYIPQKTSDTEALLEKLLIKKEDPLKSIREKIIEKEFYVPKNSIGKEITEYIKHELGR